MHCFSVPTHGEALCVSAVLLWRRSSCQPRATQTSLVWWVGVGGQERGSPRMRFQTLHSDCTSPCSPNMGIWAVQLLVVGDCVGRSPPTTCRRGKWPLSHHKVAVLAVTKLCSECLLASCWLLFIVQLPRVCLSNISLHSLLPAGLQLQNPQRN